ncbi:hypothetical protein QCE48_21575 [Caballeronia sp. LZ024]|nr:MULTISPECIES: hypothetical protein [unclassified Caballeronia]MDR5753344.1 hypothetical protein [Caballeronia sp. LZ024]MDR5841083.1 hypothetical protein [Caballeronia sp. LZ031]
MNSISFVQAAGNKPTNWRRSGANERAIRIAECDERAAHIGGRRNARDARFFPGVEAGREAPLNQR